jgi:hypothetical protein
MHFDVETFDGAGVCAGEYSLVADGLIEIAVFNKPRWITVTSRGTVYVAEAVSAEPFANGSRKIEAFDPAHRSARSAAVARVASESENKPEE